ncbi:MAG TPA: sigma-70 family RNA polymerase sigma factor [Chitinophagaceae bacterium]|nr:sigma-70 family RNA polymerase sigma factor [Chitinophagaceae bacterium]
MKPSVQDHIEDQELLEKYYASSDQQWLGILLQRYTLLLFGVCMKYLKNEEEAHDAVQQVFLKVLVELSKYRVDFFKSWLYMVAKNHCLMMLRNKDRHNQELSEKLALPDAETDLQELLANEQTYSFLEQSLIELSQEQRHCVTLFYLQKKSYQQISESTGFNYMQVKSFIQNGKRNLRALVEKKINSQKQKQ